MNIEDKHLKDIGQFTKDLTLNYQRPILSLRETEEGEYYRLVYNFKTRNLQIEDALGLIFTGFISEVDDLKKLYGWLRITVGETFQGGSPREKELKNSCMKYLSEKQVIEKYKDGYRIEPKKNYKDETVSYWMWKKGEDELSILKKTIDSMQYSKILDRNYDLIQS